jgi:hypothetical protein
MRRPPRMKANYPLLTAQLVPVGHSVTFARQGAAQDRGLDSGGLICCRYAATLHRGEQKRAGKRIGWKVSPHCLQTIS